MSAMCFKRQHVITRITTICKNTDFELTEKKARGRHEQKTQTS